MARSRSRAEARVSFASAGSDPFRVIITVEALRKTGDEENYSNLFGTSGGYVLQRQQNVYALSGARATVNDSRIENAVLRNGSLWTVHHVMLSTVPLPAGTATSGANPDNHTGVQW